MFVLDCQFNSPKRTQKLSFSAVLDFCGRNQLGTNLFLCDFSLSGYYPSVSEDELSAPFPAIFAAPPLLTQLIAQCLGTRHRPPPPAATQVTTIPSRDDAAD